MGKEYIIFQERELFGVRTLEGNVIITPQYIEMHPFWCGLAMVRNTAYQYAYIDTSNRQVIPFGLYSWCDPTFTCGFARVLMDGKWGIIDTMGNIIVPIKYDKIWTLNEDYLYSVKAFINDNEERLNLHRLTNMVILDGLQYIKIYSIDELKELTNCGKLIVKSDKQSHELFFTYGSNIGKVALEGIPHEPIIAIVSNSHGNIFPLLMEKKDVGCSSFMKNKIKSTLKVISNNNEYKSCSSKVNHMYDADNRSDLYGYEQDYYDGWNREDIESGLADAYENDQSARWNNY